METIEQQGSPSADAGCVAPVRTSGSANSNSSDVMIIIRFIYRRLLSIAQNRTGKREQPALLHDRGEKVYQSIVEPSSPTQKRAQRTLRSVLSYILTLEYDVFIRLNDDVLVGLNDKISRRIALD